MAADEDQHLAGRDDSFRESRHRLSSAASRRITSSGVINGRSMWSTLAFMCCIDRRKARAARNCS